MNPEATSYPFVLQETGDIIDFCRVCMARSTQMNPIFDNENRIPDRIEFCTGIQLVDQEGLPSKICNLCLSDLSVAHKFKETCIYSDEIFRKLILNHEIKAEVVENDSNDGSYGVQSNDDIKDGVLDNTNVKDEKLMNGEINDSEANLLKPGPKLRKKRGPYKKNNKTDMKKVKTHKLRKVLQCDTCQAKFRLSKELEDHKKSAHSKDPSWICEICSKVYKTREALYSHTKTHLPSECIKDELLNDSMDLKDERLINSDISDSDAIHLEPLQIKVRKTRGPYKKRKKTGLKKVKKPKVKFFRCDKCEIKFRFNRELEDHKRNIHNEETSWICEICGKIFIHRASLYSHTRSHFPPRFGCDRCDYKTWHKHDLVKHLRIHTGVKMYQCEYCTSSYYNSSNLKEHIRRQHEHLKRFGCTMCDKQFYDRTKLNRHIDSHNDIKRFECEICNACFTRRCYWKKHLETRHNIIIPPQRPGRQKINLVIGEDLVNPKSSKFSIEVSES